MAERVRTPHLIAPEQRIAQRLVSERGLSPPIDVAALVQEFADIEEDRIPFSADALLLDASRARPRPLIILAPDRPATRRRFTLAHEFGHVVIPWQIGLMVHHEEWRGMIGEPWYSMFEAEANGFASELLVPQDWLAGVVRGSPSLAWIFAEGRKAGVSDLALSFALCQVLDSGYLFAEVGPDGRVLNTASSANTVVRLPEKGASLDIAGYAELSSECREFKNGRYRIHWWRMRSSRRMPATLTRTSAEILAEILTASNLPEPYLKTQRNRINGVIGVANSQYDSATPEELFAVLQQRFHRRYSIPLTGHPRFTEYLAARARELFARKKSDN